MSMFDAALLWLAESPMWRFCLFGSPCKMTSCFFFLVLNFMQRSKKRTLQLRYRYYYCTVRVACFKSSLPLIWMIRGQCIGEDCMDDGLFALPAGCIGFALLSDEACCATATSGSGVAVKSVCSFVEWPACLCSEFG